MDRLSLASDESVRVVFSAPVLPLGTDLGAAAELLQRPFSVSGTTAGRFRWLSNTVAAYEPIGTRWPSDLSLTVSWNLDFLDGTALDTSALAVRLPAPLRLARQD